ncbi:MAG: hypothetical protein K0M74_17270 [Sphingopyxis sp.]|nr:hypothetical protein [Sphingopyxis sp.]
MLHTRFDVSLVPEGIMRLGLAHATHHVRNRSAFQRRLIDQPPTRNVLSDLTLESEAATAMVFRIARAFDASRGDEGERVFGRLAVALSKYWLNRWVGPFIHEAMEVHGGAGSTKTARTAAQKRRRHAPNNLKTHHRKSGEFYFDISGEFCSVIDTSRRRRCLLCNPARWRRGRGVRHAASGRRPGPHSRTELSGRLRRAAENGRSAFLGTPHAATKICSPIYKQYPNLCSYLRVGSLLMRSYIYVIFLQKWTYI